MEHIVPVLWAIIQIVVVFTAMHLIIGIAIWLNYYIQFEIIKYKKLCPYFSLIFRGREQTSKRNKREIKAFIDALEARDRFLDTIKK